VQPDTIIPDLSNPQSWNRYSYVTNRPVSFNDPTGHVMTQGDGGGSKSVDCKKHPQYCNGNDPKTGDELSDLRNKKKQRNAEAVAKVLSVGAFVLDSWALGISSLGTFVEGAGLALGEAFTPLPGADGAVGFVGAMAYYNLYMNPLENSLSGLSLLMTASGDIITGETHFQTAQNPSSGKSSTELVLGADTTFAMASVGFGNTPLTPEAGSDTLVNAATAYYDFKRLKGEKPAWGLFQYHIGHENGSSPFNPLSWYDGVTHEK
jgi:hypothetical protein